MENVSEIKQTHPASPSRRWLYLVLGTVLLLLLGLIYAWSVFIAPLEAEFGWNRAQTSMTFTITMVLFCAGGIVSGFLNGKLHPRIILAASAVLLFIGFAAASRVASLSGIYIAYGVCVGLAVGLAYNTLITMVNKWFPDKRGLASGILLMGFGMGGMLLGTVASGLMTSFGWRTIFMAFAVIFAVMMVVGAILLRPPTAAELEHYSGSATSGSAYSGLDLAPGKMLQRPSFWMYFLWSLLLVSSGLIIVGHAAAVANDLGATGTMAALIAGLVSIFNGAGRILIGHLYDRRGLKFVMRLVTGLAILSPLLLMLATLTGQPLLLCPAFIVTGMFYGGVPTISSTFTASYYGPSHYALNYSIINSVLLVAPVIGNYLAGALRTSSGSYFGSYCVMLGFTVLGTVAGLRLKKP